MPTPQRISFPSNPGDLRELVKRICVAVWNDERKERKGKALQDVAELHGYGLEDVLNNLDKMEFLGKYAKVDGKGDILRGPARRCTVVLGNFKCGLSVPSWADVTPKGVTVPEWWDTFVAEGRHLKVQAPRLEDLECIDPIGEKNGDGAKESTVASFAAADEAEATAEVAGIVDPVWREQSKQLLLLDNEPPASAYAIAAFNRECYAFNDGRTGPDLGNRIHQKDALCAADGEIMWHNLQKFYIGSDSAAIQKDTNEYTGSNLLMFIHCVGMGGQTGQGETWDGKGFFKIRLEMTPNRRAAYVAEDRWFESAIDTGEWDQLVNVRGPAKRICRRGEVDAGAAPLPGHERQLDLYGAAIGEMSKDPNATFGYDFINPGNLTNLGKVVSIIDPADSDGRVLEVCPGKLWLELKVAAGSKPQARQMLETSFPGSFVFTDVTGRPLEPYYCFFCRRRLTCAKYNPVTGTCQWFDGSTQCEPQVPGERICKECYVGRGLLSPKVPGLKGPCAGCGDDCPKVLRTPDDRPQCYPCYFYYEREGYDGFDDNAAGRYYAAQVANLEGPCFHKGDDFNGRCMGDKSGGQWVCVPAREAEEPWPLNNISRASPLARAAGAAAEDARAQCGADNGQLQHVVVDVAGVAAAAAAAAVAAIAAGQSEEDAKEAGKIAGARAVEEAQHRPRVEERKVVVCKSCWSRHYKQRPFTTPWNTWTGIYR
mmetsp:Transcript_49692/g.158692  ORF Transcript_49692/g.158692 Transcript_49692/m.158692 type:complete len:711 (-) Transcript_49692:19-2151(-)